MKFATLFLCAATTVSAASFTTDGIIVSSTLTEARTVTIPGDGGPVSYDLSLEVIFDLDDTEDKAFISGFTIQNLPDLQPITRTTVTTEFIPGDFPDPGHFVDVTTTSTIDYDAAPPVTFGGALGGWPISEDVNGFFFEFSVFSRFRFTGLLTESTSVDGGAPAIDSGTFLFRGETRSENRIRINPDLSLSLESGSFFGTSRINGFRFSYVVPEPSFAGFCFLVIPMVARRLRSRNR